MSDACRSLRVHQKRWSDDADGFNLGLSRAILSRAAAEAGLKVSNVGGWHSGPDLLTWAGPVTEELLERVRSGCAEVGAEGLRVQMWANVMRPGDYMVAHRHGDAAWSGVYYVAAAETGDGAITFARGQVVVKIVPVTGLMLLFPGALLHSVEPVVGDGTRISVAFNLFREAGGP